MVVGLDAENLQADDEDEQGGDDKGLRNLKHGKEESGVSRLGWLTCHNTKPGMAWMSADLSHARVHALPVQAGPGEPTQL
ncbi:Hypothetical predicted protein [Olea europaea subsp. europaea]|uniref:Uncharacterized protein n=1 Tax=Olea europaea subsp. europaea TaxID=158383 RepID=A0A8S0SPI0_OLEEU|nr:Hypothetical predicted protein [Olea europaea subsp. europaea]